jgi:hypothetical protein
MAAKMIARSKTGQIWRVLGRLMWLSVPLLAAPARAQHIRLVPQLHGGQVLFYQIEFNSSRTTRVESHLSTPGLPPSANLGASCILQVNVVSVDASGIRLKTYLSEKPPAARSSSPPPAEPSPDRLVEVLVRSDGAPSEVQGFDQLSAAQQFAWNSWLARFTSALTYPGPSVHVGERWQRTEPETSPSPLAKLVWLKKYQYVRDEPCGSSGVPGEGLCAVILVRAELHQKSPPDNATPEDFKRRNMVTRGAAAGSNETILYISRVTGLLIRSTEEAQQSMDATIALADGSNQVRYLTNARSRSEVRLVPDSPQDAR